MHLLLLQALLAATPVSVAVMPLAASDGITEKTADAISESIAAEVRRQPDTRVITRQELSTVMTLERQKELMGCHDDSCVAEIAGALNVDRAVSGSLARLGESWIVHLSLIDVRKAQAVGHSDRRKRGGGIDDVLDQLPGMVGELFSGPGALAPVAATPTTTLPATGAKVPSPIADIPFHPETPLKKLLVLTDGAGHYLAVVPFSGTEGPFFAGDAKALYLQRVFGGGSEGEVAFSMNFWEPRAGPPADAEFELRNQKYTLTCGKTKTLFTPLPEAKAQAFLKTAKLYGVRWQRHGYALARDDEGTYFFVDQAREPEGNTDFHLYVGEMGAVSAAPTRVVSSDSEGDIFGTLDGKLKISNHSQSAEWIQGQAHRKLTYLDVTDNARRIYSQLGAYKDLPLGTPCDPFLGPGAK